MTAIVAEPAIPPVDVERLVGELIELFESGTVAADLFAPDVFCDFTMPTWHLQADSAAGLVAMRKAGHPAPGRVTRHRVDPTPTGFVIEFAEEWQQDGGTWRSREMARADVRDGRIVELSVYCTGDWSPALIARHAREVRLLRP